MSMTFFQYSDSFITVSSSIWIYFVVTIPLSVIMLGGMAYWLRRRAVAGTGDDEESQEKQAEGLHARVK